MRARAQKVAISLAAITLGVVVGFLFVIGSDWLFRSILLAAILFLSGLLFCWRKLYFAGLFCGSTGLGLGSMILLTFHWVFGAVGGPHTYTVNDPTDANTIWRTTKPLSFDQAQRHGHCPISLPEEAKSIQYIDFYAGWGGFAQFVRFEAPVDTCKEHALRVAKERNKEMSNKEWHMSINPTPVSYAPSESIPRIAVTGEPAARAEWFDTHRVRNGLEWSGVNGMPPRITVDLDRGVFYYFHSD